METRYNGSSYKCSWVKSGTAAEAREAQRKTYYHLSDAGHALPFIELDKSIQEPVAQDVISSTQNAVFDEVLMDDQSQARSPAQGKGKTYSQPVSSSARLNATDIA